MGYSPLQGAPACEINFAPANLSLVSYSAGPWPLGPELVEEKFFFPTNVFTSNKKKKKENKLIKQLEEEKQSQAKKKKN